MSEQDTERRTSLQDWVRRRVSAVLKVYTAYDALTEHGHEIPDRHGDFQLSCPMHGPDTRPSARYYGAGPTPHFHCFTCKIHENGVGLYARFKGIKFMQALSDLEKRFSIKTPQKPESVGIKDPAERGQHYQSEAWQDVPRMLLLLEKKLNRLRDKIALVDFVKFCTVLDRVQWDLDHNGNKPTPEMVEVLVKVRDFMDQSMNINVDLV
jgi:hypothetical protein